MLASLSLIVWQALALGTVPPAARSLDLAARSDLQVVVDREPGQYLGHVSTVLLEDGKTIIAVYPRGHGKGPIVLKRSEDGGRSWGDRQPVPASWATSLECPSIHRVIDAEGRRRLILWSGLYPARLSVSDDDGRTWSELKAAGQWGGIVVMGGVERLKDGSYLAMFHDDGRFFAEGGANRKVSTVYQTTSRDGGLTWDPPRAILSDREAFHCEPGIVRSPGGEELAVLLRENNRVKNAHIIFSRDEAKTWTPPRELPDELTGDRHIAAYAPDGRLLITFRDMAAKSPTRGDWVLWVGTYDDLRSGSSGAARVRLMDNQNPWDCAYAGLHVLADGTIVATSYGHWVRDQQPFIVCIRVPLAEIDRLAESANARTEDDQNAVR